jgi:hypothetical protein
MLLLICALNKSLHRVRVTLRLVVYRQSVQLGDKLIETHNQLPPQLNTCSHSPNAASSHTRGWVCHLQLLLALAISQLYLQALGYLFITYDLQGYGGGIRPRLHIGVNTAHTKS